MAKCRFPLHTALAIRRREGQEAELNFAHTNQRLQIAQYLLQELKERSAQTSTTLQEEAKGTTGAVLRAYNNYLRRLEETRAAQQQQVEALSQECEQRWAAVVERHRQCEMLEKVHDRYYEKFKKAQQELADKELDEIGATTTKQSPDETDTRAA